MLYNYHAYRKFLLGYLKKFFLSISASSKLFGMSVLENTCGSLLIEDHCLNCNHIIEWRIQDYKGKAFMLIEFRGYFVYHFVSFYV